jgi:hypothetical protein
VKLLKDYSYVTSELILKEPVPNSTFSYSQKFEDVPILNARSMNILNFIKFEKYYCQITDSFRRTLKQNVLNRSVIAKKLNVSYATISRLLNQNGYWINFEDLLKLCKHIKIKKNEVFKSIILIKTKNSFPIEFNLKNLVSPGFFRLVGHILGDGGIHVIKEEQKYRAFYVNNEPTLINSFKKDVLSLFDDAKIYFRKREEHGDELWLPSSLGYMFYGFMQYEKFRGKRIPDFVYKTKNQKLVGALLQALYDDEGYLYPEKNMIVISQKSKELVNDIREIVKKLGIVPNQLLIHNSKTRTTMHYFSITGKENILMFANKIGFLHPVKKKKLEILVKKYR